MSLLLPETGLLFWMLVSFSVVFFLLAKFGFPVILKQADERKRFIDQSLKNAREANEQLEQMNETTRQMLRETQTQQQTLLREAEEHRTRIIEQARRDAQQLTEEKLNELHQRLEEERRKSVEKLRDEVIGLSVDMAERLLRSQLADKPAQIQLIERMLEQQVKSMKN